MKRVILGLTLIAALPLAVVGQDALRPTATPEQKTSIETEAPVERDNITVTLPWEDRENRGLGFEPHSIEKPSWGPSSICIANDEILVADAVRSRVSRWSLDGTFLEEREIPFAPGSIWCASNTHFWVFNGTWEMGYSSESEAGGMRYPLPERTIDVVTGPANKPWAVLADGFSVPVTGKAGFKRAMPLGRAQSGHAVARKTGPKSGEILFWNWESPPEVKGDGPARVLGFETSGKLGSIQPLGIDNLNRVYVQLEVLADQIPVRVKNQVVRVDENGMREEVTWTPSATAPHLDGIFLADTGQLYRFSSLETGFVVHEFAASEWKRGVK